MVNLFTRLNRFIILSIVFPFFVIGLFSYKRGIKERVNTAQKTQHPNIVFILADDMGYGDMATYNSQSKILTPNIDELARNGIKFTDAHAAAAWCTPSRFGILTGRYPLERSMDWKKGSLLSSNLPTIAGELQKAGYETGAIGKWHLGFDNVNNWKNFDYSKTIKGGPLDKGFNYFYGIHASLDIAPYFYIYNRHAVEAPTDSTPGHESNYVTKPKRNILFNPKDNIHSIQGAMWRSGKIAPHFDFEQVTPTLSDSALAFIERSAKNNDKPFFLYYAMTGPHTPWEPTKQFRGKSKAGPYGDFVSEIDYEIGRIVKKINELNIAENTIIVFASDNGPVWFKRDVDRYHHSSTYIYRGMKIDSWEGGHREPLIIDWPGKIKPSTVSQQLVSYTDLYATFTDIAGIHLDSSVTRDSYNIMPVLEGKGTSGRNIMVELDKSIREGDWKLIFGSGMGSLHGTYGDEDYAAYKKIKFALYNLKNDPSERHNVYKEYQHKADSLKALMKQLEKIEYQ